MSISAHRGVAAQASLAAERAAEVEVRQPPSAAALDDWLEQQRGPTPWTPEAEGLMPSQARFLETVIQRLKVEMREDGVPQAPASEPMRHFLLGRPGTGKSFALLKLRSSSKL